MSHKAIFFDLGNVLLFFSHDKMYRQIADLCGLPRENVHQSTFTKVLIDDFETGRVDIQAIHQFLCEISGKQVDFKSTIEAISNIFELNQAIVPIIKELKKTQIPLYVLSNTNEAHFDYAYTHFPVLHLFDGYVLSYEVGAKKPEKTIYEKALAKAGCLPHEVFYTDDIPEYVQGARNLKIDAEPFLDVPTLKSQLQKRKLLYT